MIAREGFSHPASSPDVSGPTAVIARETIASFAAVTETLATVAHMTMDSGVGHPLSAFQRLLRTYRMLLRAQASLTSTAQQLIKLAQA